MLLSYKKIGENETFFRYNFYGCFYGNVLTEIKDPRFSRRMSASANSLYVEGGTFIYRTVIEEYLF